LAFTLALSSLRAICGLPARGFRLAARSGLSRRPCRRAQRHCPAPH
jgi:hypothetical protein